MKQNVAQITLMTGFMSFIKNEYPELDLNCRQYNAIIKAATTLADELNTPNESAKANMGLVAWLKSDDVGSSSKFLAFKLSGSPLAICDNRHPRDPADFQRCRDMLDAVPELKSKLGDIASVSIVWAGLVEDWDLICQMIDAGSSREAFDLIRKNNPY
jgi:hypothetical protein